MLYSLMRLPSASTASSDAICRMTVRGRLLDAHVADRRVEKRERDGGEGGGALATALILAGGPVAATWAAATLAIRDAATLKASPSGWMSAERPRLGSRVGMPMRTTTASAAGGVGAASRAGGAAARHEQ
jgi:hypothetical protein